MSLTIDPSLPQEFLRAGGTLEQLLDKYGIKAKRHGTYTNLVMLKYDQINSPMEEKIVQQCRGIILDEDDNWKIIARPFDKFFNYGEPRAAAIDWSSARVQEKLDGSLMILYWYDDDWHVASSGTPDAGGPVNGSSETFAELFWRVWEEQGYLPPLDTECTHMFELMTKHNRVVVQHPENRLVLLGVRHLDGSEYTIGSRHSFPGAWERVLSYPLQNINEVVAASETLDPLQQEGYVVVDGNFNRVKVKSPAYVAIHHAKDGLSPKRVLDIVRKGESAEMLAHFPEWKEEFDRISDKYASLVDGLQADFDWYNGETLQKDFALKVKDIPCNGALFQMRAGKIQRPQDYLAKMSLDNLAGVLRLDGA